MAISRIESNIVSGLAENGLVNGMVHPMSTCGPCSTINQQL